MAEGVFKHLASQNGQGQKFHVESSGLGAWHVGERPDARAQRTALSHGVSLDSVAQQFRPGDFSRFDLILALDNEIYTDLLRLARTEADRARVHLLREYDPQATTNRDVPDPYYGDQRGFEYAYELIERAGRNLLYELQTAQ
ncbi:MAG: low molecular weight protein-tyrosine-phosphatase [Anaerolineales bacterium]